MIDFEQAQKMMITAGVNMAAAETNGFAITNDSICLLNTVVIVNQFKDVICDQLSDEQIEKLYSVYVKTIQNSLFTEPNCRNYFEYMVDPCGCN